MPLGQVELAFRVLTGLFVIVAPTLLFLGLWHALEAMRDDELIEQVQQRAETMEQSPSGPLSVAPSPGRATSSPTDSTLARCGACGTPNMGDATYCQECLAELAGS
ncbi:zinc ribbon domain-containing protein [Haloarcula salina]|uniref:Zinc ribbon domain-containing protein n=1 Tax=Haloarcula salina TaxID=1429914 RepID=A0AA41KI04_9EURY|nr:zinc ribbon domain-containing protein [Haloarcula salina]MBV0902336.1 zinc ribbon domain-containing protein [Haloarcula salina]